MPEYHGNDNAGVLSHMPRVSEDGLKHTGWKFDGFYPGGQGMRHAKAIFVVLNTRIGLWASKLRTSRSPDIWRPPSCRRVLHLQGIARSEPSCLS